MISRLTGSAASLNCSLLRTFVRVVETGNISAAARSLYIAQSAISAQVATLNRLAGTLLLERVNGKWRTTAAGAVFYRRAGEMLALLEVTERDLADAEHRIAGHLVLGSTRSVTDTLLAEVLTAFAGSHPDIRVVVKAGNRSDAERWLASDEVDLALAAMPLGIRGLDVRPFASDELVAVVAPNGPLAQQSEVAISALESVPLICFEQGSGVRALLEERLGERFRRLTITMELNSNDALISCVERDIGFAFLPERTARRWARYGAISLVRISDVDLTRELALVARTDRVRSLAAATFIEWLASYRIDGAGAEFSARQPG